MKDPEIYLDETMLLASMCVDYDIYMLMQNLNVRPWFFERKLNSNIYVEFVKTAKSRTHREAR